MSENEMGRSLMEMPVLEIEQKLNKYLQAIQLQLITGETPSPSLSTYVLISHLANHPPPHNHPLLTVAASNMLETLKPVFKAYHSHLNYPFAGRIDHINTTFQHVATEEEAEQGVPPRVWGNANANAPRAKTPKHRLRQKQQHSKRERERESERELRFELPDAWLMSLHTIPFRSVRPSGKPEPLPSPAAHRICSCSSLAAGHSLVIIIFHPKSSSQASVSFGLR